MNDYDARAVQTAKRFFENRGADVTITPDQYDPLDLVIETPTFKIMVEVKHQNIPIDKFGDCFVEYSKYLKAAHRLLTVQGLKGIYVMNFYDDYSFAMGDIFYGEKIIRYCPATTYFENREPTRKECWSVKRKWEFNPDFSLRRVYHTERMQQEVPPELEEPSSSRVLHTLQD